MGVRKGCGRTDDEVSTFLSLSCLGPYSYTTKTIPFASESSNGPSLNCNVGSAVFHGPPNERFGRFAADVESQRDSLLDAHVGVRVFRVDATVPELETHNSKARIEFRGQT